MKICVITALLCAFAFGSPLMDKFDRSNIDYIDEYAKGRLAGNEDLEELKAFLISKQIGLNNIDLMNNYRFLLANLKMQNARSDYSSYAALMDGIYGMLYSLSKEIGAFDEFSYKMAMKKEKINYIRLFEAEDLKTILELKGAFSHACIKATFRAIFDFVANNIIVAIFVVIFLFFGVFAF